VISLRPVDPVDEEFLYRVYGSTRELELAQLDWSRAQKDAFVRMQFDAQRRYYAEHYAGASFDVIVLDGQPVGRLYVARWPEEIRIVDIALLPEHCGQGIGTTLLNDVLAEGAATGKPVTIHVERFNPALRLYRRMGFTAAEDRGVYLLLRWEPATSASTATH
jgi:GNAT superfamily N-acetyltransferase